METGCTQTAQELSQGNTRSLAPSRLDPKIICFCRNDIPLIGATGYTIM